MRKKVYQIVFVLIILIQQSCSPSYNKKMGKAIKNAIGDDLKGYQTFSAPTDNFGLITSYEFNTDDKNFLCDMWNCIGVDNPPTLISDWLKMDNYAGVGNGASISLSSTVKREIAIKAVLPKIYSIVDVTGGFNESSTTTIDISIGKVFLRKLRRAPALLRVNSLPDGNPVKQAFINGDLVYIVADCVIDNLSVNITANRELALLLDAKLGTASGNTVASKVFKDASLSVEVGKTSEGKYNFKVINPIVFARLPRRQPSAGQLGASEFLIDDWKTPYKLKFDPSAVKKTP